MTNKIFARSSKIFLVVLFFLCAGVIYSQPAKAGVIDNSCAGDACFTGLFNKFHVYGYSELIENKNGIVDTTFDPSSPQVSNTEIWPNNVAKYFSVTYDRTSGDITYVQGEGVTATSLSYNYGAGFYFDYIIIYASGDDPFSMDIDSINVNGQDYGSLQSSNQSYGLKIPISESDQADGFTVTGFATPSLLENPNDERPAFRVYASCVDGDEDGVCDSVDKHIGYIDVDKKGKYPQIQSALDYLYSNYLLFSEPTIYVNPGTYKECLELYETTSLIGDGTNSTIIDGTDCDTVIGVTEDNVLIKNFTVVRDSWSGAPAVFLDGVNNTQLENLSLSDSYYGVYSVYTDGAIIKDSEFSGNCSGIYFDNSLGAVVSGNKINNNGTMDACQDASTGIDIINGSGMSIKYNEIKNNDVGVYINDSEGCGSNVVTDNIFSGNNGHGSVVGFGIKNDCVAGIDASYNYWGHQDGPSFGDLTSGDVVTENISYSPWFADETFRSIKGTTEVVEGGYKLILPRAYEFTVENAMISVPENIELISAGDWEGLFNGIEDEKEASMTPAFTGFTTSVKKVIQAGYSGVRLSLSKAVRILFLGEGGKKVGYSVDGENFTEITTTCQDDTQGTNDLLADDGDCKLDTEDGGLAVWTKHFTEYLTFSTTVIPPDDNNGSGGGTPHKSDCAEVIYDVWQDSCVDGYNYRNIVRVIPENCSLTKKQEDERKKKCSIKNDGNDYANKEDENIESSSRPNPQVLGTKTYEDGSLLRSADMKIYLVSNGYKKHIHDLIELRQYAGKEIFNVAPEILAGYKTIDFDSLIHDGSLIRFSKKNIYLIQNLSKIFIPSYAELLRYRGKIIYDVTNEVYNFFD